MTFLNAPIRAIKFLKDGDANDLLFWGEGDTLHSSNFSSSFKIPGSEKIISLYPGKRDSIFIVTEFRLFRLKFTFSLDKTEFSKLELVPIGVRDRVISVLEEDACLWVVLAHGNVLYFSLDDEGKVKFEKSFTLKDSNTVFYSASIVRTGKSELEIAYGTIFSGMLLSRLEFSEFDTATILSIYTIEGHKGTVFDVIHHPDQAGLLISCSDDRLIKIWKIHAGYYELIATCSGHEARVWSIDVRGEYIASVSEDCSCILWNLEGELIDEFQCDGNSKGLWAVSLNSKSDSLAIGSNDGSVVLIRSLKHKIEKLEIERNVLDETIKMFKMRSDGTCFICTNSEKLIRICSDKTFKVISYDVNASALAIDLKDNLFIGECNGDLLYFNSEDDTCKLLFTFEEQVNELLLDSIFGSILVQLKNRQVYLIIDALNCVYPIKLEIESKYLITSFTIKKNPVGIWNLLVGTRQGMILSFVIDGSQNGIYSFDSLLLNESESIKLLAFQDNGITSAFDRSGYEFLISTDLEVLERKKICRGQLVGQFKEGEFVYYFHQRFLIIQHLNSGMTSKIPCGGNHRQWDICINEEENYFNFAFLANGTLNIHRGILNRIKLLKCGSHGKEIRCASILKDENCHDELLISGSEDGLINLRSSIGHAVRSHRFQNISIKCITTCFPFIFVGGSNESIEVLKVLREENGEILLNHIVGSSEKQNNLVETRVLSLDCMKSTNSSSILLLAGYSDSSIRMFEFGVKTLKFELCFTIEKAHQVRCVQQIRFIPNESKSSFKFVSAGADGIIQSWKVCIESWICEKIMWNYKMHESGINSIDICQCGKVLGIVSGGDDGSVSLLKVENDRVKSFESHQSSHSSITSVSFLIKDDCKKILSASIDRSIILYDSLNEFKVFSKHKGVISDISAMTVTSNEEGLNSVTVYGMGQESFIL